MSRRIAELAARRARLIRDSGRLREQCAEHAAALAGPLRTLEHARRVLAGLRRVPLRVVIGLARAGLGEALSSRERRSTLIAGVATGAAALVRRWRRRRASRPEADAT